MLDSYIAATEKELAKSFKRMQEAVIKEIESLYAKIESERLSGSAMANHLYSYQKYFDMLQTIHKKLQEYGSDSIKIMDKKFLSLYKANSELLGKQFHLPAEINIEEAKMSINSQWVGDGLNYSDRVWKNVAKLQTRLQEVLTDGVASGLTNEKITQQLMSEFGTSYYATTRLVRTEMSHIYNTSALDRYKEAGFTEWEWLTAKGCCKECEDMNGKKFTVNNSSIIPAHPFADALLFQFWIRLSNSAF